MRKWWIVPVIMIATLFIGIIGAAWSQRPIVEYMLSDYPENFDSTYKALNIWLNIKNTGASYARLDLIFEVKNGNITIGKTEQGMTCNGTHLVIHYDLPSGMGNYDKHYATITPVDTPENITLNLVIENLADLSIPNGFICRFLEPHGYTTSIIYGREGTTTTYALVS